MDRFALDQALLNAHEGGDIRALVTLYAQAGDLAEREGQIDAACFYLTQAFVFALEAGHPAADMLNLRLYNYGRVHRLTFS